MDGFHLPLCGLTFLSVWKRSGIVSIENWFSTTTSSAIFNKFSITNPSTNHFASSTTDTNRTSSISFRFGTRGNIGRGLFSGGMLQTEVEEIHRSEKTWICSISPMEIEKYLVILFSWYHLFRKFKMDWFIPLYLQRYELNLIFTWNNMELRKNIFPEKTRSEITNILVFQF